MGPEERDEMREGEITRHASRKEKKQVGVECTSSDAAACKGKKVNVGFLDFLASHCNMHPEEFTAKMLRRE